MKCLVSEFSGARTGRKGQVVVHCLCRHDAASCLCLTPANATPILAMMSVSVLLDSFLPHPQLKQGLGGNFTRQRTYPLNYYYICVLYMYVTIYLLFVHVLLGDHWETSKEICVEILWIIIIYLLL